MRALLLCFLSLAFLSLITGQQGEPLLRFFKEAKKSCAAGCEENGNCNAETGECQCRFGYGGESYRRVRGATGATLSHAVLAFETPDMRVVGQPHRCPVAKGTYPGAYPPQTCAGADCSQPILSGCLSARKKGAVPQYGLQFPKVSVRAHASWPTHCPVPSPPALLKLVKPLRPGHQAACPMS